MSTRTATPYSQEEVKELTVISKLPNGKMGSKIRDIMATTFPGRTHQGLVAKISEIRKETRLAPPPVPEKRGYVRKDKALPIVNEAVMEGNYLDLQFTDMILDLNGKRLRLLLKTH